MDIFPSNAYREYKSYESESGYDVPPISPATARSDIPFENDRGAIRDTILSTHTGVSATNLRNSKGYSKCNDVRIHKLIYGSYCGTHYDPENKGDGGYK